MSILSERRSAVAALACLSAGAALPRAARAQSVTKWDCSLPWGPSEFHTVDAQKFADAVKQATRGEVLITIHPGGALGVRANETVRALSDGSVPMAEFAAFQNVGDVPLLGIESLPFLVDDYAQLKVMHSFARPAWERALAQRGVKVLYIVPWPSQNFFTKKPIRSLDDLKGVKMRVYDKVTADMSAKLGMVPQQMNNPDVVPALAAGRLDAVMTSGTTAVAQKYWEFLKHTYNTNHLWASNLMSVSADAWKQIKPEHQAAIERVGREMEPQFWQVSQAEHATRMGQLKEHGMTVEPADPALLKRMREVTQPMWEEFAQKNGPDAQSMLEGYRAKVGK